MRRHRFRRRPPCGSFSPVNWPDDYSIRITVSNDTFPQLSSFGNGYVGAVSGRGLSGPRQVVRSRQSEEGEQIKRAMNNARLDQYVRCADE